MDVNDRFTVDDIWKGLQVIENPRSYRAIETCAMERDLYVSERRKRFIPASKLAELIIYLGVFSTAEDLTRVCRDTHE